MLLILTGKSGSSKSTIEAYFERMISFTTRIPREGEIHGRDYYFLEKNFVEQEVEKKKKGEEIFFIECEKYGDHYYGVSKEEFERIQQFDLVVNVMEMKGAKTMKQLMKEQGKEAVIIWLEPSEEIRIERLRNRQQETNESDDLLQTRIKEDYRDKEKMDADVVLENNGTIEEIVEKVRRVGLEYQSPSI